MQNEMKGLFFDNIIAKQRLRVIARMAKKVEMGVNSPVDRVMPCSRQRRFGIGYNRSEI